MFKRKCGGYCINSYIRMYAYVGTFKRYYLLTQQCEGSLDNNKKYVGMYTKMVKPKYYYFTTTVRGKKILTITLSI